MLAGSSGNAVLNPSTRTANFMGVGRLVGPGAEDEVQLKMPISGVFSDFNVTVGAPPANGDVWKFTVDDNGGPTPLSCTISLAESPCSDAVDTSAFSIGTLSTCSPLRAPVRPQPRSRPGR